VQFAGPHLGVPVGRRSARDAGELERYGEPLRRGDPQLLRSPLDLDAGASGEQQMRAGPQIPPLQTMPEVGARGVDRNQLRYFDAGDESGHGVRPVSPIQLPGVQEQSHRSVHLRTGRGPPTSPGCQRVSRAAWRDHAIADLNRLDLAAVRLPNAEFSSDMLLVLHVP
jgi:hypothetical protein